VTVYQICLLHGRPTSCSRRRVTVCGHVQAPFQQPLTFAVDLISYCARENVPFTVFEDWSDILKEVKRIVAGETTVKQAAAEGFEQYKKGGAGVKTS
jgi:hypothetical protein